MNVLVIDVGTSSIRASVMRPDGVVLAEVHEPFLPSTPFPGLVEFDPAAMSSLAVALARQALDAGGPVEAVGIANQRASTVVWDPATGEPVGPGLGWQDLRTAGDCIALRADGLRFAPNQTATKAASLLDAADPDRRRRLLVGTVDAWLVWNLTSGAAHVTDVTNASVTGLMSLDGSGWDTALLEALRIPADAMPAIVDSTSIVGPATALPGSPPIGGIVGDQQASLVGQSCVLPGLTKITFGTGGMLDMWLGHQRPEFPTRGACGTFPIITTRRAGRLSWGIEGIMLAAGTNVEWLRDDLGIIDDAAASHAVAAQCDSTDGVVFVPALLGLGTPQWDHGARGTLLGVTRGTTRAQLVRAVLEGVAHSGADLIDAAEADSGMRIESVRVDGGMSANPTFVQALADAAGRRIELSPVLEATTRGAAYAAALGAGVLRDEVEIADLWQPRQVVEPAQQLDRDRWAEALERSAGWHGDLSAIDF